MSKLKVCDKFIFHKCSANKMHLTPEDFTIGKIYHVCEDSDELYFNDDNGDKRSIDCWAVKHTVTKFTKIKE